MLSVNRVSYQPNFGMAKPKLSEPAKIVSEKKPNRAEKLNDAISLIGWASLILAFVCSSAYGIVNGLKNRTSEPAKTEQVEQPEKIVVTELTPVEPEYGESF